MISGKDHEKFSVHLKAYLSVFQLLLGIGLLTLTLYVGWRYHRLTHQAGENELPAYSYKYHISMITGQQQSAYWRSIYEAAREEAAKKGAYVELMDEQLVDRFSVCELLDMAYYSHTDGVLLYPEDDDAVRRRIDKMVAAGIPVVTMERDAAGTKRTGFVGENEYFLGREFGRRILAMDTGGRHSISVLAPSKTFGSGNQFWFQSGIASAIGTEDYVLDIQLVAESDGLTNAEAVINQLLCRTESMPNLVICLDQSTTELAYQIIKDRGLGKHIDILGSCLSDIIKEGIRDGGIQAAVTIDPDSLGQRAAHELIRYLEHHLANYFTDAGLCTITRQNLEQYEEGARYENHSE